MKRARLAWRPRCGGAPAGGVWTGHEYRYFMMELPVIGMLKCPVNINFAKVIVFIDGFLLTVFVLAQSCLKAKAGKAAKAVFAIAGFFFSWRLPCRQAGRGFEKFEAAIYSLDSTWLLNALFPLSSPMPSPRT
ncbi:MAG TPA: hypothetical protein VNS29_03805 [Burkholderiaceae bacterium]|nr:hypothetical protein [Burkholderiaceae bacterium]